MSNKGQLLQDPFLNLLRKEHVPVSIYLVNGIKLQGHIESFDQYVVLLAQHRDADGLQARDLDRRAGPRRQLPRGRNARGDLKPLATRRPEAASPLDSETAGGAPRAILVGVDFGGGAFDASLDELALLAESAGDCVVERVVCRRKAPDPALFVGSGKADEIKALVLGPPGRGGAVRPGAVGGAAAQPRAPPGRRGGRPHDADPRDLRRAGAEPRRQAAGRTGAAAVPVDAAGAALEPPRAPAAAASAPAAGRARRRSNSTGA